MPWLRIHPISRGGGALIASTINAASIGKSATHGSLEVGKVADLLIINAPRYVWVEHTFCQPGVEKRENIEKCVAKAIVFGRIKKILASHVKTIMA